MALLKGLQAPPGESAPAEPGHVDSPQLYHESNYIHRFPSIPPRGEGMPPRGSGKTSKKEPQKRIIKPLFAKFLCNYGF
jgi:hypothetical protein